jgi:2-dehydro-3-deoxygluconokinase
MKKIITFGEIMMRLSAPQNLRFAQANSLDITYGGGEANVSASLAQFGLPSAHITCLPANDLGKSCKAFFQELGVDIEHFILKGERLGLYFLEVGAAMRASKIVYDRADSAFAHLQPEMFDWEEILQDAQWFHWTGITAAISENAAKACLQALQTARKLGVTISSDVNYRRNLWQYGKKVQDVMPELVRLCDVVICAENDAADIFGIKPEAPNSFVSMAQQVMERFPQIKKVLTTRRISISASHNQLQGILWNGQQYLESPILDINPIIDRIGGGDAFMAGFIYGILQYNTEQKALDFATSASALKHTISGDINLATVAEVEEIMQGNTSGKLLR